jgi:hypothetical protein
MSGTAASRYEALCPTRQHYIDRAEKHARVTIPALFPDKEFSPSSHLYTPYQSVGARGVNNLASKLLLSLFPPNSVFFKLSVDELTLEKMTGSPGFRAEVDKSLGKVERKVLNELETSPARAGIFEALKQNIVAGNVLLHVKNAQELRVFPLRHYVVKRSPEGTVLEIIVEERIAEAALPDEVLAILQAKGQSQDPSAYSLPSDNSPKIEDRSAQATHCVYTYVRLEKGTYYQHQEISGELIPGTEATYPADKNPWLALRFTKVDGQDYGRAYVEEYYGDLWTLECLMEALTSAATVLSKVIFFVDPTGTVEPKSLAEAEGGDVLEGKKEDVTVLQVEKSHDLSFAKAMADEIIQRLSFAFLLNTAIQRNGERVTAEEIRYMARELEDVLGGTYSVLSQEFQLPFVKRLLTDLAKRGEIPHLPKEIQPLITTGISALGRGHDIDKLDAFLQGAQAALGPQLLAQWVNVGDYLKRRATALSIDDDGLIKTQEQVTQEMQQAQLAALGPQLVQGGSQLAKTAMEQHANGGSQQQAAGPR